MTSGAAKPVRLDQLPGGGKLNDGLSTTKTQSPLPGGVKFWVPVVEKVPMLVATPLEGLYHHAVMVLPEIRLPLTVTCREDGR